MSAETAFFSDALWIDQSLRTTRGGASAAYLSSSQPLRVWKVLNQTAVLQANFIILNFIIQPS